MIGCFREKYGEDLVSSARLLPAKRREKRDGDERLDCRNYENELELNKKNI